MVVMLEYRGTVLKGSSKSFGSFVCRTAETEISNFEVELFPKNDKVGRFDVPVHNSP